MKILIFLVFINIVFTFEEFDFIEIALKKYVDHSADPCENFYRHACPLGSPRKLISEAFQPLEDFIIDAQKFAVWNNVVIKQDAKRFSDLDNVFSNWEGKPSSFLFELANLTCEISDDLFFAFLPKIQKIGDITFIDEVYPGEEVKTCSKVLPLLNLAMNSIVSQSVSQNMNKLSKTVSELLEKIQGTSGHLIVDVRRGIASAKSMVDDMKELAKETIKDTPWALRNNVTEDIDKITAKLNLHDNFAKDLEISLSALFEIEKSYLACQVEFAQLENADIFCYIYQAFTRPKVDSESNFYLYDNGYNKYPKIVFGYPSYYHNQYGKELSAKLGFTGFTAGHEIGHTLVDDHERLYNMPFFSENAQNCIQNQYKKSCEFFKEADKTCIIYNTTFDDNGADIVGLQLAYTLFENTYGHDKSKTIERLGVTHEQLFFYAFALPFCNGEPQGNIDDSHSPRNARVNAAAQHPGFQEAFQCDSNSRMMQSATEQCHVYGSNAPQTRKSANPKVLRH